MGERSAAWYHQHDRWHAPCVAGPRSMARCLRGMHGLLAQLRHHMTMPTPCALQGGVRSPEEAA